MFCCTFLYVPSSFAIILMGKRELVALLYLSWCLVMVEWLFLAVTWGCLRFVIVVFPDHTHLLLLTANYQNKAIDIINFVTIFLTSTTNTRTSPSKNGKLTISKSNSSRLS